MFRHTAADIMNGIAPILFAEADTGKIIFATQGIEQMFACKVFGELLGLTVEELIPERFREGHKEHRQSYAKSPRILTTSGSMSMGGGRRLVALRRNGTEFEVQVGLFPAKDPMDHSTVIMVVVIPL